MVKQIFGVNIFSFVLISFYATLGRCTCDPAVELPTSIDDYIENISAHYKNEIQILDFEITQMELAFAKEISIVAYSQDLASKLARKVESRLRSTGSLNMKGKVCIQHFIGNVTAENNALQGKLRTCVDTAKNAARTLPDTTKTHVRNARQQLVDLMNTDVVLCRKNNGNNAQKLTDCAREKLKIRETNIQNYLKAGSKEIEGAMCRADILAKTAQECSFTHLLENQTLIAEILSNVNTCIGDKIVEIRS